MAEKYTPEDVIKLIRGARNLNAAVKKLLKAEGDSNPRAAKFAKDLRDVFAVKNPAFGDKFVHNNFAEYQAEMIAVIKYAYSENLMAIAGQVFEKYGDDFNNTYADDGEKVTVSDQKNFDRIFKEVTQIIDSSLKAMEIDCGPLMRSTLLATIFEPRVLKCGSERGLVG